MPFSSLETLLSACKVTLSHSKHARLLLSTKYSPKLQSINENKRLFPLSYSHCAKRGLLVSSYRWSPKARGDYLRFPATLVFPVEKQLVAAQSHELAKTEQLLKN